MDNLNPPNLKTDKIVCIIPTLNESLTVAEVVKKSKRFVHRVVVVDGYSEDGTSEIAWNAGADVIFQDGNGKGTALRTALNKIYGDIYVTIDGDATYDPLEMQKILDPVIEGKADMVVGSRLQGMMEKGSISLLNTIGNKLFNFLINTFFHGNLTDTQSGFRALNRQTVELLQLTSEGFEIETEMTVKCLKLGLKVLEVPISYVRRRGSPTKLNAMKAGIKILKTILFP